VSNQYHFLTRWRVEAPAEDVYDILSQPLEYPRWWPSVYLDVRQLRPGRNDGTGLCAGLVTKGWLPYALRWESVTTEARRPNRIAIAALGDFLGRGIWSIVQHGKSADITFDWKVTLRKPLVRYLSFAFRPLFEANHRWAMEQGRASLELELARSRARTVREMNAIAEAPGPYVFPVRQVVAGAVLSAAVLAALLSEPQVSRPGAAFVIQTR
jgi:hypothetical protein